MSRRQGPTWAATSVPEIRRQWCNAVDQSVDRFSQGLAPPPPGTPEAGNKRRERMQAKLATEMEIMKAENDALRGAEMFWVARDMVDVALHAALTLPEWTPAIAAPAPNGLLCWARPAGSVPYGPKQTSTTDVPWDSVWWWIRPGGMMQLVTASRFTKQRDLIAQFQVSTPLWAANTIVIDPKEARTEEANGTEDSHPFVSVVGAAWLLMAQANVAETRTIGSQPQPQPRTTRTDMPAPAPREPSTVTIVELRQKPAAREREPDPAAAGRTYTHRWPVEGYWRQQPYGPNNSQRKPKYITDHVKGPEGAPLIRKDRVHVLRKGR
ncbi:hypothetical protein HZU40_00115 (plasmid) [Mycolicibacterium fluoranthenivorans]|uniref:Uncharacterized protein n=1 Tax=Mycolicibacterium fluoranthenivorans TaxID=258505 RepID=A0A7G8P6E5_9MYCO|nr:hypothetical protein [Mycolicibacterium fluoranthenivorans]QNJ89911.1 hypothetical protein HZU40_00115 [Mycolicibacterium fluoranthenivorans]